MSDEIRAYLGFFQDLGFSELNVPASAVLAAATRKGGAFLRRGGYSVPRRFSPREFPATASRASWNRYWPISVNAPDADCMRAERSSFSESGIRTQNWPSSVRGRERMRTPKGFRS